MELKLNTEFISKLSDAFVVIFLKSVVGTKESTERYNFLEMLLGFVYASKKVLYSMHTLEILSDIQIKKIEEQLNIAVSKDIPSSELIEKLKSIFDEGD